MNAKEFLEQYKIIERTDLEFRCKVPSKERFLLHDIETKTMEQLMEEYAQIYHESKVKKLTIPDVSNNEVALIEPLRNFIKSKHLSNKWKSFLKEYQKNR